MTTLHQRAVMFADLAKGGYMRAYEILDGETVIGHKTITAKTGAAKQTITYALGDLTFDTANDFIAAYEAQKAAAP